VEIQFERAKYLEEIDLNSGLHRLKESYENSLLSSLYEIDHNNEINGEPIFQAE